MLTSARIIVTAAAMALMAAQARSEVANAWKIINGQRDPLTEQAATFAVKMPTADPVQHGKSITTALVIKCTTAFVSGPTHPELMILFTSLTGRGHAKTMETRYRFDDGPVRDYKLASAGKTGTRAIVLPKFSDQDPIADIVAAKRLRVEVNLPETGTTLLDFNVSGASDAIQAISCK
jgi:hypothetical protein